MYADDLGVIIRGKQLVIVVGRVLEHMKIFGNFSRLRLNMGKSGVVFWGAIHDSDKQRIEHAPESQLFLGLSIAQHIKYLGVQLGNVSSDSAYSRPLGEAQRRANVVAFLHLSIRERIILLKTWVLPTILLTARAYHPMDITIKAMEVVCETTLGVDSWGVTLHELAQEPELGGYELPTPKVWLHAQFGLPFHKLTQEPHIFAECVRNFFSTWCTKYGVPVETWALPYLQLGLVPYKTFSFLAYSLKSLSITRQYIIDGFSNHAALAELPPWHSAIFKSEKHLTYYCLALVAKGITKVAHD